MYSTVTNSDNTVTDAGPVPVLISVIDLASTMKEKQVQDADDDILKLHLESKHASNAPLLLQMRKEKRLVVLLDGMDEAGMVKKIERRQSRLCIVQCYTILIHHDLPACTLMIRHAYYTLNLHGGTVLYTEPSQYSSLYYTRPPHDTPHCTIHCALVVCLTVLYTEPP